MLFILFHNVFCFFIYKEVEISNYFSVVLIPLFVFFTMFQIAGYIDIKQFNNLLKTLGGLPGVLAIVGTAFNKIFSK